MATWKGAAVAAGVFVVLAGGLALSGVLNIKTRGDGEKSGDDGDAKDRKGEKSKKRKGAGKKKSGKIKRPKRSRRKKSNDLSGLGYVDGMVDENVSKSGVEKHDRQKASPGLNFYSSRNQTRAQLMDMEGKVVHVWDVQQDGAWQHVTLLPDGDIVVLIKNKRIFRADKNSKVQWTYKGRVHHDLWVTEDDHVFSLARRQIENSKYHPKVPVVEDYVVELSPKGEELSQLSVLKVIEKSPYAFLLNDGKALSALEVHRANPRKKEEFDILHTNHIEVIDGKHESKHPALRKGNFLVSPRNTHTIMIMNPETEAIEWLWGTTKLIYPHHPTLTPDGNVMVFNNGSNTTGSQIVEVDPSTNEIVWTYGPNDDFFSNTRGSNQRLPNGNTLITESDPGYVFEVTKEGDVVWRFLNPHVRKSEKLRMAIWRVTRFTRDELTFKFNRG